MWVTNRKNAYKVIRVYKKKDVVRLVNFFGCKFTTTKQRLDENRYKFTPRKPSIAGRGGFKL